jgi:hypothetical protein
LIVFPTFGVGALGIFMAQDYPMGTALRMGPGYFPIVLSATLILFGSTASYKACSTRKSFPETGRFARCSF